MRSTVSIVFGAAEVLVEVPAADAGWAPDEARRWLDTQFVAHDCEPLRASGKVLTVDKLVAIAEAIGLQGFEADPALRLDYARATVVALARPVVRVDVEARAVSY
jgi:hypothetical protein